MSWQRSQKTSDRLVCLIATRPESGEREGVLQNLLISNPGYLLGTLQQAFRIHGASDELGVVPMAQTARDDGSMSASGDASMRGSHMRATFRVDGLFRRNFRQTNVRWR